MGMTFSDYFQTLDRVFAKAAIMDERLTPEYGPRLGDEWATKFTESFMVRDSEEGMA